MDVLNIPGVSVWINFVLTIFSLIVGGYYIARNARTKAENTAKDAQKSAIDAMQVEMIVLRNRVDDVRKENTRLTHVIDTICSALKTKGILITIEGEMINIDIGDAKKSTTIRIQDTEIKNHG